MSLKECWYGQNSFCIDCSSVCNLKGMKSLVNGGIATLLSNVIKRKLGQIILDFGIQSECLLAVYYTISEFREKNDGNLTVTMSYTKIR